jgi:phosphate starvation-inducible PhoH-like protein
MHQDDFTLEPADNERLANLAGPFDAHLRQIELHLGVEIANRGNVFRVTGRDETAVQRARKLLQRLYEEAAEETFDGQAINLRLNALAAGEPAARERGDYTPQDVAVRVKRGTIRGRGPNQQ